MGLADRSYDIVIGEQLQSQLADFLKPLCLGKKLLLVTNPPVKHLYGRTVEQSLHKSGYEVTAVEVPDSEQAKSLDQAQKLYDIMYQLGFDRQSAVLALGGGVVGDLAGFVAATYMRGVALVQIPTTLLAQVDSSVGGKVAINHPKGKNIIGAFYQPKLVLSDTDTLKTLNKRDVLSGLAEVIKTAIIMDGDFFRWLEVNINQVLQLESTAVAKIVEKSCQIKAQIVEADEKEQGQRAILNYGHTVGHAVEMLSGYDTYRHGEAVAIGMVAEANIALELGLISAEVVKEIKGLLERSGLPTEIPDCLQPTEIIAAMYKDKKVFNGALTITMIKDIGQALLVNGVAEDVVLRVLKTGGQ